MNAAKVANPVLVVSYYISTGRLNAMYTLRCCRHFEGPPRAGDAMLIQLTDSYICNLAAAGNEELAEEKATAYVDALRSRLGDNSGIRHEFTGDFDAAAYKRRGKLSARESRNLDAIERGIFPFGKHADKAIVDAPESYVLYFSDKLNEIAETDLIMQALASACAGVALERGYIARRDAVRALSQHVGAVGERREFEVTIKSVTVRHGAFGPNYFHIMQYGQTHDVLVYSGSKELGRAGDTVRFKATIKAHTEYKGTRQTVLARPSLVGAAAEAGGTP